MSRKVIITDEVHPFLQEGLEKMGLECEYHPDITLEEVKEIIASYYGIIINSKIIVDKYFLDKAKNLKFIGRLGSGLEIIDRTYAAEKEVAVLSAPEGNRNAVAEHALGMLLALKNNLLRADREVRKEVWEREKNRGFEIMGKKVGIIGFGNTGEAFAKKLSGMGVEVLAYDKYRKHFATDYRYIQEVSQETVQREADIISLHLPLTPLTHHMVDEAFLEKCKAGVVIINTSRGQIIKTSDLLEALKKGSVEGACLDVFENEKPKTFSKSERQMYNELYEMDQVVLTPHVAGWTYESKERLATVLLKKIESLLKLPVSTA